MFGDMDEAQEQVIAAIVKAHHSFYTQKKNPDTWHIICRDKAKKINHNCPFKVRVTAKDGEEHTCLQASISDGGFRIVQSFWRLATLIPYAPTTD